jgi:hypothetical protein
VLDIPNAEQLSEALKRFVGVEELDRTAGKWRFEE